MPTAQGTTKTLDKSSTNTQCARAQNAHLIGNLLLTHSKIWKLEWDVLLSSHMSAAIPQRSEHRNDERQGDLTNREVDDDWLAWSWKRHAGVGKAQGLVNFGEYSRKVIGRDQ